MKPLVAAALILATISIASLLYVLCPSKKKVVLKAENSTQPTIQCSHVIAYHFVENQKTNAVLHADTLSCFYADKKIIGYGLQARAADFSLKASELTYLPLEHIFFSDKRITLSSEQFSLDTSHCHIDLKKGAIELEGGVVSEFCLGARSN